MVAKIQRDVDVNTSAANGMSHMAPGTEYFVTLLNSFVEKYWEARLEGKQRKLCEKIVNTIQGRGGAFYKKAKGGYTRLDFESALKATDESLNEILIVKGKSKKRGKDDDIIFTATERVPKKHVVYGTNKWENSLFTPSHLSRYSDPNTSPKERGTIIQSIFEVLTNKFEKVLDPLSSNRLYVVSPCKWKEMIMGMLEDYKAEKEKYPNLVIVDAIQDDDFRPWKIDDSTKGSAIVISQVAKYNDPRASQTDKTNLLLNVSRRIEAGGGKIFEPLLRFNQYREIDPRFAVGTLQRFVERHTAFKMRMLRSEKYENNLFRAEAIGAKDVLYGSVLWENQFRQPVVKQYSDPNTKQKQRDDMVERVLRHVLHKFDNVLDYIPSKPEGCLLVLIEEGVRKRIKSTFDLMQIATRTVASGSLSIEEMDAEKENDQLNGHQGLQSKSNILQPRSTVTRVLVKSRDENN